VLKVENLSKSGVLNAHASLLGNRGVIY